MTTRFQTLVAVPTPDGLEDLNDLYAQVRQFGVGITLSLFVEDGEIRIKADVPEGEEPPVPPNGLAEFLAAYSPPPPLEPSVPYIPTYADLRADAYALEVGPIEQQIDAIFKSMTFPDGSEAASIQAKRQAIKDRHPKPTP